MTAPSERRFYVYTLSDPRDGQAFYVGKGIGSRRRAHESEARRGGTSAKACRIRDIWAAGMEVGHQTIGDGLDEAAALRIERDMIECHRHQLTNIAPGGGPCSVNPARARRQEAFRAECRRLLDEIAVPTVLRRLRTFAVLDLTNPEVRWCLNLLRSAGVREIEWRGDVIGAAS